VFPAEPSWVTFKALLLPPEGRKDDWSERERPRVVEVDLTVQNWEKELLEILSVDYSDLTPEQKVRTTAHARTRRTHRTRTTAHVHTCQCTTGCVQAKQKPKSITFSEATLVYSGRGPVNHRASTLAQCIVRGHALLNFGGFKGKSFHSLLRPGTTLHRVFVDTTPHTTHSCLNPCHLRICEELGLSAVERRMDAVWPPQRGRAQRGGAQGHDPPAIRGHPQVRHAP
jgi:hypothetical protein